MEAVEITKYCCTCKISKTSIEFNKQSSSKDGLQSNCRECQKITSKQWHLNNREYHIQNMSNWQKNNREHLNEYFNKYLEEPQHRIAHNLRSRLGSALKIQNTTKNSKTLNLLNISFPLFIEWINLTKKYFIPKDYKGVLNNDHFFPLSKFNLRNEDELKLAMHWSNIRVITQKDNCFKKDKLPSPLEKFKMLSLQAYFISLHPELK
jgi:hypothetical protein